MSFKSVHNLDRSPKKVLETGKTTLHLMSFKSVHNLDRSPKIVKKALKVLFGSFRVNATNGVAVIS